METNLGSSWSSFDASHIFDNLVPKILSEQPQIAKKVNAVLGIELYGENGGYWTIDLTENPSVSRGKVKEPKCILSTHVNEFKSLLSCGSIRACLESFKQKRIEAKGHLPTILKLEVLLRELIKNAQ